MATKSNLVEFVLRQPVAGFGQMDSTLNDSQAAMLDGVSPSDLSALMADVILNVSREPIINSQFHLGSDSYINGCVLNLNVDVTPEQLSEGVLLLSDKRITTIEIGVLHHKAFGNSPPSVMMRVCPVEMKKTKTIHTVVFDVAVYITDKFNTYVLHHFIGKIKVAGGGKPVTKTETEWAAHFNDARQVSRSDEVGYLRLKFEEVVHLDHDNLKMVGDTLLVGFHSLQSIFTKVTPTVVNVQEIDSNSQKRFLKRTVGISKGSAAVFPLVGKKDVINSPPTFIICEGVATGLSLHLALKGGERGNNVVLCCGSTSILTPTMLILIDNLTEMRKEGGKRYASNLAVAEEIKVVIAGENDSNMSSKKTITKCLDEITVPDWMEVSVVYPYGDHNDFNDMLNSREAFPTYEQGFEQIRQIVFKGGDK